jgi:hypothetical protein
MSSPPPDPTHLIIVCCHAIYAPRNPDTGGSSRESNWLIEPFQTGETQTYVQHVEAGVRALAEDCGQAILVFSGGATKLEQTRKSEAEGYLVSRTSCFSICSPSASEGNFRGMRCGRDIMTLKNAKAAAKGCEFQEKAESRIVFS